MIAEADGRRGAIVAVALRPWRTRLPRLALRSRLTGLRRRLALGALRSCGFVAPLRTALLAATLTGTVPHWSRIRGHGMCRLLVPVRSTAAALAARALARGLRGLRRGVHGLRLMMTVVAVGCRGNVRAVALGAMRSSTAPTAAPLMAAGRRPSSTPATSAASAAACEVLGARRIADPGHPSAQHALDVLELLGVVGRHQR